MSNDGTNEGQVVTADAQFTVTSVMRPVSGFQTFYEGTSAARPIYLFPEGENVDKLAADELPGYDPDLARGLSVPIGARIALWLPNLFWSDFPADPPTIRGYRWTFIWRLRNLIDFRQGRIPYHFPRDEGTPDTTQPAGRQARVPLPAAYNTITYIQPEPASELGRAVNNIHSEDLEASTFALANPLLPDGSFQPIQQGILDPAVTVDAEQPQFMVHEMQAMGDELLIGLSRSSEIVNWTFGTTDLRLSQFLGATTPNVGVYVMSGTAP